MEPGPRPPQPLEVGSNGGGSTNGDDAVLLLPNHLDLYGNMAPPFAAPMLVLAIVIAAAAVKAPLLVVTIVVVVVAVVVAIVIAAALLGGGGGREDHFGVVFWRPYGISASAFHPPPPSPPASAAVPPFTMLAAMPVPPNFVGVVAVGHTPIFGPSAREGGAVRTQRLPFWG
jgi:hypothetical protein